MKRRLLSVLLAGAVLALGIPAAVTVPGCASGPAATGTDPVQASALHYVQVQDLYSSTVRTMTALSKAGKVSLADMNQFEQYRSTVAGLLDQWHAAILAGQPWDGWSSLESVLGAFLQMQAQAAG